jgi:hypothetical protein
MNKVKVRSNMQCSHVSNVCSYDFERIVSFDLYPLLMPGGGGYSLCGLVVRVLGYRFGGLGSIPSTTRFSGGGGKENK